MTTQSLPTDRVLRVHKAEQSWETYLENNIPSPHLDLAWTYLENNILESNILESNHWVNLDLDLDVT